MTKTNRSLITRRAATTVLAAAATVTGHSATQAQSTIPVPALINWAGVTGTGNGAFQTLIATTSTGNRATNWDTGGDYLVATGGNQSGNTQTSETVTLGTYLQAGGGGGASLGDSNPYYYFGDTPGGGGGGEGAQIGYNGGSMTMPLEHPEQVKHIYLFMSSGGGNIENLAATVQLNWAGGTTSTFSETVNDWIVSTDGENGDYLAITNLGYANSGNWTAANDRQIFDIPINVGSSNYGNILDSITISDSSSKRSCGFLGLSTCGENMNFLGVSTTAVTPAPPGLSVTGAGAALMSVSLLRARRRRSQSPAGATSP